MSSGSLFAFSLVVSLPTVCWRIADRMLTDWFVRMYMYGRMFCSALFSRIKSDWRHETAYLCGNVLNGFIRFKQKIGWIGLCIFVIFVEIFFSNFDSESESFVLIVLKNFFLHWYMGTNFDTLWHIGNEARRKEKRTRSDNECC